LVIGVAISLIAALYFTIMRPPSYAPKAGIIEGEQAGRLAVDLDRRARWFAQAASQALSSPVSVEVKEEEANAYFQTSSEAQAGLAARGIQNPAIALSNGELILIGRTNFHGALVPVTVRGTFAPAANGEVAFKVNSALLGRIARPENMGFKIESAVNDALKRGIGPNRISGVRIDGGTITLTASPR
jgi:hypothetical protein